jgi:membrane protein DedA with SNARE-associated domain
MIDELVARWGYAAILVGTFFEGETVLVLGGALAHRGILSLPGVMLAAFVGSVAGDQLWFFVGARGGQAALTRHPRWQRHVSRVSRWFDRYGSAFVVSFRFLYGMRTMSPVLLGASGYPMRRFLYLNMVGAGLWAASFAALGWGIGAGLRRALGRHAHWDELALVGLVLVAAVAVALRFVRRRLRSVP